MSRVAPHNVGIIGGGLAGLSSAYLISLLRPSPAYHLYIMESSARLGGWIQTVCNSSTGAYYDLGPHTGRVASPSSSAILRLALSLGLRDSIIWLKDDGVKTNRYLFLQNKISKVPITSIFASPPFTRSPFGLLLRLALRRRAFTTNEKNDISIDEFFRTRIDGEFADYIGSALVRGIFAGDSRNLVSLAYKHFTV
ncbi:unnamed protein product [Protopolystoma xenopodis]|uniref:Uncharacterized protein n=1 Tax=Protopolystoma xenopodis TaxID=117903 RepID=A0A3S5CPZ8_9PLAT|nr:unnamed protein product [Protopolystoma xenopodis]